MSLEHCSCDTLSFAHPPINSHSLSGESILQACRSGFDLEEFSSLDRARSSNRSPCLSALDCKQVGAYHKGTCFGGCHLLTPKPFILSRKLRPSLLAVLSTVYLKSSPSQRKTRSILSLLAPNKPAIQATRTCSWVTLNCH